jgi:predicted nucleic acid-binding protein
VILADSNVLLDVITADRQWARWSQAALDDWSRRGPILINPVIYAELAPAYDTIEKLDAAIAAVDLEFSEIPRAALFLASRAFVRYRRRGGTRRGVLPDFFVGAHAAVLAVPLLTRDTHRYRVYFPTLRLVAPIPGPATD